MHLGPFGCIRKLGAKRADLVQKFVPRSSVGIVALEFFTTKSPEPSHWIVKCCFGAFRTIWVFGTVWLRYENRCKKGRTSAKVRATKLHRNFSQRTHPIHPIRPYTIILVRFVLFGCIRDRLVALRTRGKTGRTNAKVRATKSCRNFSQ